jgi:hypothetical protein
LFCVFVGMDFGSYASRVWFLKKIMGGKMRGRRSRHFTFQYACLLVEVKLRTVMWPPNTLKPTMFVVITIYTCKCMYQFGRFPRCLLWQNRLPLLILIFPDLRKLRNDWPVLVYDLLMDLYILETHPKGHIVHVFIHNTFTGVSIMKPPPPKYTRGISNCSSYVFLITENKLCVVGVDG